MKDITHINNQELQIVKHPVDREIAKIDATKSCIDSGTEFMNVTSKMLQSAEYSLNSMNNCLNSVRSIVESAGSSVTAWKEIEKEMFAMSLHFEQFSKELDVNLDKYKTRIPLIEKQLDSINVNLSKMLDYVLAMDAKTEQGMDFKMKMMDRIDVFLNTISTTMMNLL
ncbi:MAG TPA: hypothetical protein DHU75_07025 [Rikenellaceae bacterium]|nr:hypothetical protein [Rikenellaceae bacterium]